MTSANHAHIAGPEPTPELGAELGRLAGLARLLVATDYDGVVAPIVRDPARAFPLPGTVDVLRRLAAAPGVTVALISGRDRATLHRLSSAAAPIVTVGSHGAEWDGSLADTLDDADRARRAEIRSALRAIAQRHRGAAVEPKPLGAALHVRNVIDAADGDRALDEARRGPATAAGVFATEGKAVLELSVRRASKGDAVRSLKEATAACAVLYFGDDVTDESVFTVLTPADLGIKVGPGATAARLRVPGPVQVRQVLTRLAAARPA